MKTTLKFTAIVSSILVLAAGAHAGTSESGGPSVVERTENAVVRGAKAAGRGIERGVQATARGVDRGAKATGNGLQRAGNATERGVKRGAEATEHGVKRGAKATSDAVNHVAARIGGSSGSSSAN